MPSQRPFFLSSFIAAFRQQGPSLPSGQQPNKHVAQTSSAPSTARTITTSTATAAASSRSAIPIPSGSSGRRGSDSSSEGFRDALGADKWYVGGRTAGGEEKFFKLGVVRRVRSNDGLSLDRLSL